MGTVVKKKAVKKKKIAKKKAFKKFELPDLDKDPYFIKKAEEARKALIESGIIFDEE